MFPFRALVLEDHAFQRAVAVNMLHQLGCGEVLEAADGAEALLLLQNTGPVDVALCDLQMNGMDGLEFMRKANSFIGSVILCSELAPDLRRTVMQIIAMLGINPLGDAGKPLQLRRLQVLLENRLPLPKPMLPSPLALELPNEDALFEGFGRSEFVPFLQPKLDLATGQVKGVEVLARWLRPGKGLLPPSVFMPVIERYGLLDVLLSELLASGLALQRKLLQQGHSLEFSYNLHASQLENCYLIQRIQALLKYHGVPAGKIVFELTESAQIEDSATSLESLVRLRMMGCGLSIDDFGIGFSSLRRLCQLPFTEMKLDAEFVHSLTAQPRSSAVIESTLVLAKSLGITLVMEGVETREQHQELVALGCSVGQGYLYARPMGVSAFVDWLGQGIHSRTSHEYSNPFYREPYLIC
ncbi:EAL domain-containing response regulator [Pseudomonas chlororaphis]|uniref:EAL domain-containing response regulator n=1 Tax=Pseudomonas chlororaphis TaxID=587753 RepID=UPI000F58BB89|nr:EAL domain-containing response regulator [Pseudomonas chlororaphis]AZD74465.1 diguanylate cyclase/phosphodiesterase [Pseudomonas chlororaphis subsp. aurantiaca]